MQALFWRCDSCRAGRSAGAKPWIPCAHLCILGEQLETLKADTLAVHAAAAIGAVRGDARVPVAVHILAHGTVMSLQRALDVQQAIACKLPAGP